MLSEKTLRRRAAKTGYEISKGFQHYHNGGIVTNYLGEKFTGYNVIDTRQNSLVWPCYNQICDHLFTLEDVESLLKEIYQGAELNW